MTRDDIAKQTLPILKAFAEGEKIEILDIANDQTKIIEEIPDNLPLNLIGTLIKIKP